MTNALHISVLAVMLIAAFFALWFKDLISSVISLAVFSLMMALEFYILQAPDVAIAGTAARIDGTVTACFGHIGALRVTVGAG